MTIPGSPTVPDRGAQSRRIALFGEGQTEHLALRNFFHKWLDPKLPQGRKVGLTSKNFRGVSKYLAELSQQVESYLTSGTADFVFGLVDLYGLPKEEIDVSDCSDIAEKVSKANGLIRARVPVTFRKQFIQHFAVHEVEAWLLAYPQKWPQNVREQITKRPPEQVNFTEPPSKFLARLLPKKYKKTVSARNIFSTVDPNIAYEKSPYLRRLLDDLLEAAKRLQ